MGQREDASKILNNISTNALVVPATREILTGDLKELFTYWLNLRGSLAVPLWDDFEMENAPPKLMPLISVVEVRADPLDFIYVYWGEGRVTMQHGDYLGKSVRDFRPQSIADKSLREDCEVVARRTAICMQSLKLENEDKTPFEYQTLRLPFSSDGTDVSHILSTGHFDQAAMTRAYKS